MLHRVYDLCAAHCSPRDADSGRIVVYIVIILPFPSAHRAMFKRTKALDFQRERPVLEHKSRSLTRIYINIRPRCKRGSYSFK